jgi:phosphoglycerol geranylgeranyltransferase
MNNKNIFNQLTTAKVNGRKSIAVLIDPDYSEWSHLERVVQLCIEANIDYFLIGGSLLAHPERMVAVIDYVKKNSTIPTIIFPGSYSHIHDNADSILLLSLVSGRNADFLIGNHVIAAPMLKKSNLEILPTAYLLIDGGTATTVSYISNTTPLPQNKPSIAACTAMAAEMLGMKLTYLDAGSGALQSVNKDIIKAVAQSTNTPIIVGGGIDSAILAKEKFDAGADVVVIGNAIERNPRLVIELKSLMKEINQ